MTVLDRLNPAALRALAAVLEARDPQTRARRSLTDEGAERLADILLSGSTPTIGFWRRYGNKAAA